MKPRLHCLLPTARCLLLAACCLLPAVAEAQCGPGGCCPNGQCGNSQYGADYGGWRSSQLERTQVLPALPPAPPVDPAEVEENQPTLASREYFRAVVRVKTVDRGGANSYGSGTAVLWGNRLAILTANHVVRDARAVYVRGRSGTYHRASIMKRGQDKTWDVVVLVTHTADDFPVAVKLAYRETGHPKPGEKLMSCGFGGDGQLKVNHGKFRRYALSTRDGGRGPSDWLILSGYARGGDSGGPVFNEWGELVGVLWGTDGQTVVATQCGRLHVIMRSALGEPTIVKERSKAIVKHSENGTKTKTVVSERKITLASYPTPIPEKPLVPVQPTGILNRDRDRDRGASTCRPNPPQQPQVIVQSDPNVSRKLDVLIQNTTPAPAAVGPEIEEKEEPAGPSVGLMVGLAVAGGLVVGFIALKAGLGKSK